MSEGIVQTDAEETEAPKRIVRPRARQSRGRGATRSAPKAVQRTHREPETVAAEEQRRASRNADAEFFDDDGVRLTRRSRRDGGAGDFDIPAEYKKTGWDYEWKTISVNGQGTDGGDMTLIYEQGWRPVKAETMPRLCPPGWDRKTIDRYGQRLFTRPMALTREARKEELERADKQKSEKLRAAMSGGEEDGRHTRRMVDKIEIEGEVGRYAED